MDARKLVGMTEGAKKRKARWESNSIMLPWRRAWRAKYGREYSIGTKLRPCPGCKDCGYAPTIKMWRLSRDAMWTSGSLAVNHISNICGGSGVLPAKKEKAKR